MKHCLAYLFLFSTMFVNATTYYVDNQHAQANDTNPGTASQPLKTIVAAANKVAAGDMVIVKAGTYNETVIMRAAGAAGQMITFKADPRRKVKAYRFMMAKPYTRVEGFELSNPGGGIGVNITADNVEVVDNYIHDMDTGIGTLRSDPYKSNMYVAHNYIYYVQQGILIQARNSLFEFNEVERLYNPGSGDSDYSRVFGENVILRGNYFHGSTQAEIKQAHVDCFQTFTDNGEVTKNIIIERNICNDCHQGFMGSNVRNTETSNFTFRNNVFDRLWAWSICTGGIKGIYIYNNVLNGTVGIRSGGTGIIKNNIMYYGMYQPLYETPQSVLFENNLVAKPGGTVDANFKSSRPNNVYDKDPLFVNSGAGDFHIKAGSPCINAGADLGDLVPNDMDDHARPYGGGFDIGPDEYGSTVTDIANFKLLISNLTLKDSPSLPNPMTISQAMQVTREQGIRWFRVAGKPIKYQDITSGVYLVTIPDVNFLQKIVVTW